MEPALKQFGPLLGWLVCQILPSVQNCCYKEANVQGGSGQQLEVYLGRQGVSTGSKEPGNGLAKTKQNRNCVRKFRWKKMGKSDSQSLCALLQPTSPVSD